MTYLFNERKPKAKAHWWVTANEDTACRMWRSGGMNQRRPGWTQSPERGLRPVCQMCRNVLLGRPP